MGDRSIRRLCLLACVALPLAGCAAAMPSPGASNCAGWRAIRPSRTDVLTRGTKEQIVTHNEHGVHSGCWKE